MNVFWICGYDKPEIEMEVKEFRGKQKAEYEKEEQRNAKKT